MDFNKKNIRKTVEEIRWKEWMRDAVSLRNKTPQETLKMMFELCEFTQKLKGVTNEKLWKNGYGLYRNIRYRNIQPLHQYFSSALGQLIYICMSHLRHQGGNMDIQQQKELYVVDYDLPATNERRQFYRYLKKVSLARSHNAHHANVYKCVLVAEHPIRQMQKIQCFHVPNEMYK